MFFRLKSEALDQIVESKIREPSEFGDQIGRPSNRDQERQKHRQHDAPGFLALVELRISCRKKWRYYSPQRRIDLITQDGDDQPSGQRNIRGADQRPFGWHEMIIRMRLSQTGEEQNLA